MRLSILDQSVASAGRSHGETLRHTLALAEQAEAWGYHRFWVSEHHGHPSIVGTAPEVLMAAVAARTRHIRIGSAGVMLPHYSAYKVAEQFRVLHALAPGRIDLGVGRAPGSDGRTAQLLNPDPWAAHGFDQQVADLQAWVSGGTPAPGQPGHGVPAYPMDEGAPSVWVLGSSLHGAQLAAQLGLPYAFAAFITDGQGVHEALQLYRQQFRPRPGQPRPQALVCVWALAAETAQEAWTAFESRVRWRMDRQMGRLGPLLPPDQAQRPWSPAEAIALARLREQALVGDAPQVAARLRALATDWGVDELAVITWSHDPQVQSRSYALLAQAWAQWAQGHAQTRTIA